MVAWSHYVEPSELRRGDHIYALRKLGIYQHHGIVIAREDANRLIPKLPNIEAFMVIEQNQGGIRVVTLQGFTYETGIFEREHSLRRAQYNENPFIFGIKRRGSCHIKPALQFDLIVENAILLYNNPNEKEKWCPYSLLKRNCEHFAFTCSTNLGILSEQVLAKYDLLTNTINTVTMTAVPIVWGICKKTLTSVLQIGEKLLPSTITNVTITSFDEILKSSLKGSAITAVIALGVEIAFLTIRWIVYLCIRENKEKLKNYLAAGFAIETNTYVKSFIQAIVANGSSFAMSIAGALVGAYIPLPGATVGFSIFFGFIGYVISRWSSGAVLDMIEKLIDTKTE